MINQAFDVVQQTMANNDRDSIYLDAISLSSDKNSIGLSRQSIYHSIQDVHFGGEEETSINLQNAKNDKIWHRFHDGNHPVDFVLAYNGTDRNQIHLIKRQIYERNLTNEGLLLEKEETQKIHFVKLHIPKDVLCRYAEIMKLKFPIRQVDDQEDMVDQDFQLFKEMRSAFHKITKFIRLDSKKFPRKKYELYYEFSRDKSYLFNVQEPNFFSSSVRIAIINFILERTRYSEDRDENTNCVGIEKLLSDQAYIAAYPLHDGNFKTFGTHRNLLYTEWSSISKWMKYQPLDNIKEYFGAKIALYFAWLGFFSYMLVPAAIVGFICFLGGLFSIISSQYANEVCHSNEIMCPRCDNNCDFWNLRDACGYFRISHLFDNNFTIAFAVFMSFWAIFYLEQWKRYSANIFHRWGMTGVVKPAERPRTEYMIQVKRTKRKRQKMNSVTRLIEPSVSFWRVKMPSYLLSYGMIALGAIVAIVIYRITILTSRQLYGVEETVNKSLVLIPFTAAILNLIIITLLNHCYEHLARYLTDIEYRRTQSEYDDSLSLKIYLFQFVNYYSAIIYIAFLKGNFLGSTNFFGSQEEQCLPGGCLLEIFIQLAITMIGKQAISVAIEISMPFMDKLYKILMTKIGLTKTQEETTQEEDNVVVCNQWTEDFKLQCWNSLGLFEEYLEMIIQFGFLAFVVVFPLAPLFVLINNIFEMRVDAKKFLLYFKRSVPKPVSDIGIWNNIVQFLGKFSVVISAFIIAFSSNFIPKMFYQFHGELSEGSYLEFMFAKVNISDIQVPQNSNFQNLEVCWNTRAPKTNSLIYWEILVARLLFVVIYQNAIGLIREVVCWLIPEKPTQLKNLIKREEYLTSHIIIMEERKRALLQNMQAGLQNEITIVNRQRYYEAR